MAFAIWAPRMLSVLRIMTGLLFMEHGMQKFFAFPSPGPALTPLLIVQGLLELVGGILIVIGLFTRPVALILAGDMAVAYFMRHTLRGFFPTLNGGQLAILFCFVFLICSLPLAARGASISSGHARTQADPVDN
jgi:putative oxidoreductase